jgi:hypothetical protein
MGNQWKVLVHESREELQHRLRYAVTATRKERVQMLYWIKTEAHATRQELSQRLAEMNQLCIVGYNGTRRGAWRHYSK